MYKESYYNIKATGSDNNLLIYNTKSGAFVSVEGEDRINTEHLLKKPNEHPELEDLRSQLLEGRFILDDSIDEYYETLSAFRAGINEKALIITIMPTETCNFRCAYCYEELRHINMPPSLQRGIIKYIENVAADMESLHIAWYGGEPIMAKEAIINIMRAANEIGAKENIKIDGRMTTNGYLLTIDNFRKFLNLGIKFYQVTIDGIKQEHDKLRTLNNGRGTYDVIWANLKNMKQADHDFSVRVRVIFHKENWESIYQFADCFASEFGSDNRFFIAFRPIWTGEFPRQELPICSISEGMLIQNRLNHYAFTKTGRMEEIQVINSLPRPIATWCPSQRNNYLIISADGTLWKCDLAVNHLNLKIGNLKEDGSIIIDSHENAKWTDINIYTDDTKCKQCKYLPICQGGCSYNRFKGNSICLFDNELITEAMKTRYEIYKSMNSQYHKINISLDSSI